MFTLKLYRNGPLPPSGRTVVLETAGLWVDHCENGLKYIRAFKKTVGVQDEDGTPEFFVGMGFAPKPSIEGEPPEAVTPDNLYSWGVLENAQGKTTEMFR